MSHTSNPLHEAARASRGYRRRDLLGVDISLPSVTLRYRLTLNAQVEGRPVTGSGVIQVTYAKNPQFLGASAQISIAEKGEAVVLDLASRGVLFALLKGDRHPRSGSEYIIPMA